MMLAMTKGSTLEKNVESLVESVGFIINNMVTKADVRDIVQEEVGKEVKKAIEEKDLATKEDIKGIVSSAHNRIDQEVEKRKQLEVRVTKLERKTFT